MHLNLASRFVAVLALAVCAFAAPSPTVPIGSTTWNVGDNVEIKWEDSTADPPSSSLKGINVYFMTGPDIGQIKLATIQEGLSNKETSVQWTVPEISQFGYPAGKIYFIMFTDSANPDAGVSWSTRFSVLDGTTPVTYDPKDPWPFKKGEAPPDTSNSTDTSSNSTDGNPDDNPDNTANQDTTNSTADDNNSTDSSSTNDQTTTVTTEVSPTNGPNGNNGPAASGNIANAASLQVASAFVTTFIGISVVAALLA